MKTTWWRACIAAFLLGACLALGGCLLGPNFVLEGPGGYMAVVLEDDGRYDSLPEGGALWLLDESGAPLRALLPLGEERDARPVDWSPEGEGLLVLVTELGEYGLPQEWKLLYVPLEGDPVELVHADELILSARYGPEGDILYSRSQDDSVALISLDPATSEETVLSEDILAFLRWQDGVYILGADGTLRSADGAELALRTECLEDDCDQGLQLWPGVYLDVSSTGRYVALALEQAPRLVYPEVGAEPTLYLVDLVEETAVSLAAPALFPTFSPDGSTLAFIAGPPEGPGGVYLYHMVEGRMELLEDSAHSAWVRWGPGGLIVAVEELWDYELRRWKDGEWTVFDLGGS